MSYRIRPGKPLEREVVRIAEIQYRSAIDILRRQPDGPYQAIHDARKRFKRLRGLLRLIRGAAPEFSARENARLRDVAATLSAVRDATALVEALDHLLASGAAGENRPALSAIRARLAARRDCIATEETDLEARITVAIATCQDGIEALGDLRLPRSRQKAVAVLAKATARNYGKAVSALETAVESGNAADWHDLRKRIKYHRMHVQLLSRAWPGEMALRAGIADLAGEALGDAHDLDALKTLIATDPDTIGDEAEIAVLRVCMITRSTRLHDEVRKTVSNLLRDAPDVLEARIAALWRDAAG
ncbi:CHAD domain-containing protein [Hoeflea sp. AS16]|uniref:CHAD domain-containing protein n=1 Tax=Hoeflea sp. AS16 TaxID=3135779 RepID=UPI00317DC7A1